MCQCGKGCLKSVFLMKALDQSVLHGLTIQLGLFLSVFSGNSECNNISRKIKETFTNHHYLTNNGTDYCIWLLGSENKCFIKNPIL